MGDQGDDDDRQHPLRISSTRPVSRSAAAQGADAAEAAEASEAVDAAAASGAVDPAAPIEASGAASGPAAIADALAAGSIDAAQARALLIADAVDAHLPAGASPELVSRIRAEVEAMLASDPVVAELLRRR
jgi:hypothetical protein